MTNRLKHRRQKWGKQFINDDLYYSSEQCARSVISLPRPHSSFPGLKCKVTVTALRGPLVRIFGAYLEFKVELRH